MIRHSVDITSGPAINPMTSDDREMAFIERVSSIVLLRIMCIRTVTQKSNETFPIKLKLLTLSAHRLLKYHYETLIREHYRYKRNRFSFLSYSVAFEF